MDRDLYNNARWLIGAISRGINLSGSAAAKGVLSRLAVQEVDEAAFRHPQPATIPVLAHLASCVAETMLFDADLAAAIASVEGQLHWARSQSYTDAALGDGFAANYGWCHIIGPSGFFHGDDFLLGLLLLGPGRHYRDHVHPAPELYWPLTPRSSWKQGGGSFAEKPAGTIIWHQPNEVHATRTAEQPLLAVWAWTHDTATPARLLGP